MADYVSDLKLGAIRKMLNDDDAARHQNAGQVLKGLANVPTLPMWETSVTKDLIRWEQVTPNSRAGMPRGPPGARCRDAPARL